VCEENEALRKLSFELIWDNFIENEFDVTNILLSNKK